MRNYVVYFELYGKKMKTTILAESEEAAKEAVRGKLVFHNVEKSKSDEFNQAVDLIDSMIDMLGKKKG